MREQSPFKWRHFGVAIILLCVRWYVRYALDAPTGYKDIDISRDAQGHYYASLVYEEKKETFEQDGALTIDLGVKTLATGVNEQRRLLSHWRFQGWSVV